MWVIPADVVPTDAARVDLTRFGRWQRPGPRQAAHFVSRVIALSLTASLNPTLVAATTVMLLLPRPKKLMLGYLCGALVTSITLGLVIVSSLSSSSTTSTAKNVLSPAADLALGAIALTFASVVYTGRHEGLSERRRARKAAKPDKGPPRWQRELSKGSARTTFIVGVVLSLPGRFVPGRPGGSSGASAGSAGTPESSRWEAPGRSACCW